jgi:hypothetical protein
VREDVNTTDLLLLNLREVRRRSLTIWRGIPAAYANWKPDNAAMSCGEIVRHVLEGEFLYTEILRVRGSLRTEETPFSARPFTSIEDEISFANPFRTAFLDLVHSFEPQELDTVKIDRSDKGYVRSAGDFILRMAYHEAVHAGQLLSYLRMLDIRRPNIWD